MPAIARSKVYVHVFITEQPVKLGQMAPGDKYSGFTALCHADVQFKENCRGKAWPNNELRRYRNGLSLREHWHDKATKPTCDRCSLLQAILKANVPKAERHAFTLADFVALMERIDAEMDQIEAGHG